MFHFQSLFLNRVGLWTLLVFPPLLWGGNFVVGRFVGPDVPAATLNFLRWSVAAVVLLPIGAKSLWEERAAIVADAKKLVILSLLGVIGFNTALYQALQEVTASQAALAFAFTPFVIIGMSYLIERTQPDLTILAAATVSLLGVYYACVHGRLDGGGWTNADTIQKMAPPILTWSAYCLLLTKFRMSTTVMASFLVQIFVGVLLQGAFLVATSRGDILWQLDSITIWAILYLGIFAAAVAFLAWQFALRRIAAHKAGLMLNLVPLSGVFFAWVFLGEHFGGWQIFGGALIGIGLAMNARLAR